jgi:hypothetical protein
MNNEIVAQYGIEMSNYVMDFPGFGKELHKSMSINIEIVGVFFHGWKAAEIDDSLLPDIEEALATPGSEVQTGSPTVTVLIYNDIVDFYDRDLNFVITIPTLDLKEIAIMYRDFLLEPPLAGTKVDDNGNFL